MNKERVTQYLIGLGVDNAVWDIRSTGDAHYAVDRNTKLIALIPAFIHE